MISWYAARLMLLRMMFAVLGNSSANLSVVPLLLNCFLGSPTLSIPLISSMLASILLPSSTYRSVLAAVEFNSGRTPSLLPLVRSHLIPEVFTRRTSTVGPVPEPRYFVRKMQIRETMMWHWAIFLGVSRRTFYRVLTWINAEFWPRRDTGHRGRHSDPVGLSCLTTHPYRFCWQSRWFYKYGSTSSGS